MALRVLKTQKSRSTSLLKKFQAHSSVCPCHSCQAVGSGTTRLSSGVLDLFTSRPSSNFSGEQPDYAFELASSNIRFGPGSTLEVGMDFKNLGVTKVALFTDNNLISLDPVKNAVKALESQGIGYDIYSNVIIEPKDYGVQDAIEWARAHKPQAYLAVGGGSVMDTAKIANLFQTYAESDLLDFVNAPIGKGLPVEKQLQPLIAVPTTAGTGSETTGTAIFDLTTHKSKTGISSRALKPLLGIVDPLNTISMPNSVKASSGLDVLCHSLESYTAVPFNQRTPRPTNPKFRPAYQGANPISDIFSLAALEMVSKYLPRAVRDPSDLEAQTQTLLAATLAGIGFGNAGVHLCHGLSYPISSQNRRYKHHGYNVDHPIVPHGVSVAITAPAVFKHTAASNPDRYLTAAKVLGANISTARYSQAGDILSDTIKDFLHTRLGSYQPKGIKELGFTESDLDSLVQGALPQKRVLNLSPSVRTVPDNETSTLLRAILEDSLSH